MPQTSVTFDSGVLIDRLGLIIDPPLDDDRWTIDVHGTSSTITSTTAAAEAKLSRNQAGQIVVALDGAEQALEPSTVEVRHLFSANELSKSVDTPAALVGLVRDEMERAGGPLADALVAATASALTATSVDAKLPANTAAQIGLIEAMRGTDGANTTAPLGAAATQSAAEDAIDAKRADFTIAGGDAAVPTLADVTGGGGSSHTAADVAALILETPANKIVTDIAGKVTTSNPAAGSGSSHTASDVAALILETPANKLATNVSGEVTTDTASRAASQAVGFSTAADITAAQAALIAQGNSAWLTATGFATPANVTDTENAITTQGNAAWSTATGFSVAGDAMALTPAERAAMNAVIEIGQVGVEATAGRAAADAAVADIGTANTKLDAIAPTGGRRAAGEGAVVTNLDDVSVVGSGGTTQPRVNKPAGRAFRLKLSDRDDGTHQATRPIRLRPGAVGTIAVSVDMSPLWGDDNVKNVGDPEISGGNITAIKLGPRDSSMMVQLGGTATASETVTCTTPVTMDTDETVKVTFDIKVFAD